MFENFSKLKQTSQKIIKKFYKPSSKDEKKNFIQSWDKIWAYTSSHNERPNFGFRTVNRSRAITDEENNIGMNQFRFFSYLN